MSDTALELARQIHADCRQHGHDESRIPFWAALLRPHVDANAVSSSTKGPHRQEQNAE